MTVPRFTPPVGWHCEGGSPRLAALPRHLLKSSFCFVPFCVSHLRVCMPPPPHPEASPL